MKTPTGSLLNSLSLKSISSKVQRLFDYEAFFAKQIQEKKDNSSYRVFKKILRSTDHFPEAFETSQLQNELKWNSSNGEMNSVPERHCSYDNRRKMRRPGKNITIWCSNDYLDLSMHPAVIEAIKTALTDHGTGSGGSRSISGNSPIHAQLEEELARFHQKESGLVFSSGFVANDTALHTLGTKLPGLHYFSDAGNHSSIITGIRNSRAHKHVFRHNDPCHLNDLLSEVPADAPKVVVFESVHSMDGSIAPCELMCDVARSHNALTLVDEVHAVGLYGPRGSGIGDRDGCVDKMDIISSTLGKSFGVMGGYIVGPASIVDTVRSYGNGFIFTTALPPHVMAGGLASLRILASQEGKELREKLHKNVAYLRQNLLEARIPIIPSTSHVIPVMVGDARVSTMLSNDLIDRFGIYVQPINYPSVPQGTERLRVAPTPGHTRLMMDRFVDSLTTLWTENDLRFSDEIEPSHASLSIGQ